MLVIKKAYMYMALVCLYLACFDYLFEVALPQSDKRQLICRVCDSGRTTP